MDRQGDSCLNIHGSIPVFAVWFTPSWELRRAAAQQTGVGPLRSLRHRGVVGKSEGTQQERRRESSRVPFLLKEMRFFMYCQE